MALCILRALIANPPPPRLTEPSVITLERHLELIAVERADRLLVCLGLDKPEQGPLSPTPILDPGYEWVSAKPIMDSDEYWDYSSKKWVRADDEDGWGKRLMAPSYRRKKAALPYLYESSDKKYGMAIGREEAISMLGGYQHPACKERAERWLDLLDKHHGQDHLVAADGGKITLNPDAK